MEDNGGLPPRRRKDRVMQVCVEGAEHRRWLRIARERDVSLSQLIREQMRKLRDGDGVPPPVGSDR